MTYSRIGCGVAAGAMLLLCAALSGQTPAPEGKGLHLSVQKDSVTLGSNVELHLEIVPDHLASVAIVLGIIRPDEKMYYYKGQAKGFALFEGFDSARPLATDFPFNTSMSVVQSVALPADWPAGKYQFIAAVMKDGSVIEIDHSNCFTATAGTREKAEGGK